MDDFKIIAHRGASGWLPENTFRAFQKAVDVGARWVELDVRFSRDNVPMVIHDVFLGRTTHLRGRVNRTLSSSMKTACGKQGDPIPTLEEVLQLLDRFSVKAYIELKQVTLSQLPRLLETAGQAQPGHIISSFNHGLLEKVSHRFPVQALFGAVPRHPPKHLSQLAPVELGVDFARLGLGEWERVRRWGFPVSGYTVNDVNAQNRARAWGLCGVFTDFPTAMENLDPRLTSRLA